MELIGSNGNTLSDSFMHYYKNNYKSVRIKAQITQDKKIALYDQDGSMKRMKHLLRENILTLDEYLRHIPSDLNVIIDITRQYGGKQNTLPNDVACRIIMATKKRGKKNVIYASSDRAVATIVLKNRREAWLFIDEENDLTSLEGFPKLCVDKGILHLVALQMDMHLRDKDIYVNNVSDKNELEALCTRYVFIKGGIVDC